MDEPELDPRKLPPNIPNLFIRSLGFYMLMLYLCTVKYNPLPFCFFFPFVIATICNLIVILVFPYRAPPILGGLSLKMRSLNRIFWSALAIILIPFFLWMNSVNGIFARVEMRNVFGLSWEAYENTHIAKKLIAKGDKVVDPLINIIETEKNRVIKDSSYYGLSYLSEKTEYRISLSVFVIGKIGGKKSENYLAKLIEEDMGEYEKHAYPYADWRNVAIYAYADCCGRDAIPSLMNLYDRIESRFYYSRKITHYALIAVGGRQFIEENLVPYLPAQKKKISR
jgi:hypothetical protein